MSDFGRALRILRIARGLGQKEVAGRARISKSSLSEYETGKKTPTLPVLTRLLEALEASQALHAEAMDFLRYLHDVPLSGVSAQAPDESCEIREVQQALTLIGRGATCLVMLAFRLLSHRGACLHTSATNGSTDPA